MDNFLLPGSKKTMALSAAYSFSSIWMSWKGWTSSSSTRLATRQSSVSGLFLWITQPLPADTRSEVLNCPGLNCVLLSRLFRVSGNVMMQKFRIWKFMSVFPSASADSILSGHAPVMSDSTCETSFAVTMKWKAPVNHWRTVQHLNKLQTTDCA